MTLTNHLSTVAEWRLTGQSSLCPYAPATSILGLIHRFPEVSGHKFLTFSSVTEVVENLFFKTCFPQKIGLEKHY